MPPYPIVDCKLVNAMEIEVFDRFLLQGSILSVVLMVYAGNVMIEALRIDKFTHMGLCYSPRILSHPISAISMISAVPCSVWPAVYIGLYDE